MKSSIVLMFSIMPLLLLGQSEVFGTWQAIDDKDGEPSSYIEIYEENGKLHGKIAKILEDVEEDVVCDLCDGDKKDQPILGLEIIWDMKPKGKSMYKGGRILDPENGKSYKCRIKLVDDVLEVRGYIGVPALGRTQKWYRVE